MDIISELLREIQLPKMVKVRQKFRTPQIADVAGEVRKAIKEAGVLSRINEDDRVAIAVGSRGVADLPTLVRETVAAVKEAGGNPHRTCNGKPWWCHGGRANRCVASAGYFRRSGWSAYQVIDGSY